MAIFNSYVSHYQRIITWGHPVPPAVARGGAHDGQSEGALDVSTALKLGRGTYTMTPVVHYIHNIYI